MRSEDDGQKQPEPAEYPDHEWEDMDDEDDSSTSEKGQPHPTGDWIIMGDWDGSDHRAWINDAIRGDPFWQPEGAMYLSWLRDGAEVGLIGSTYTPDPNHPAILAGRLQSEMSYWFERWSWPARQRLSNCPITMRTGWPTALLPTPDPDIVFFEWYDQGEAGYEGISIDDTHGDAQLSVESYELGYPRMEDPQPLLFSPDVRYLIRCHSLRIQERVPLPWAQDLVAAFVTVIDRVQNTIRDIPIQKTLPPNWIPTPENAPLFLDAETNQAERRAGLWVYTARILDQEHVVVRFVDGSQAIVTLADDTLATLPPLPPHPDFHQVMPNRKDPETKAAIDADYKRDREPPKHVAHPHELVAIVASGDLNIFPSKHHEWICDADGQHLWGLDDALMLVWLFDGTQVGVLRGAHFSYHATEPQSLVFERWSWPDRICISHLHLAEWSGDPREMWVSPTGNMLSIVMDGRRDVLYRLAITSDVGDDRIIASVPFSVHRDRIIGETSDDAHLISLEREGYSWPTHADMFRHARRFLAGKLAIYDFRVEMIREIPLLADFPPNWAPPDLAARRSPLLPWFIQTSIPLVEEARLIDDATIYIRFATKEERMINIAT